jgi:hypothetical protein
MLRKVRSAFTVGIQNICLNGMKYGLLSSDFRSKVYYFEFIRISLKIMMQLTTSLLIDFQRIKLLIIIQQLLIYQAILS